MRRRPLLQSRRCACAGFTLIELIVVISLVAIFFAVALDRLLLYQEHAEKAAMDQTIAAIKSGLQLRAAVLLVRGEERNIGALARTNPVEWLVEPPAGYRGEFLAPNVNLPRGSWYFDAAQSELVYLPNRDTHLKFLSEGDNRIRFRAELDFEPAVGSDTERKHRPLVGTRVVAVTPYVWF
jgi:prepilin-type N-terminal cleavage/methylation domain-containing protein